MPPSELDALRAAMDVLNRRLVDVLHERARLCRHIGARKKANGAAAADPVRHWPIVLVGFLGKIFGPIGYLDGVLRGEVPAGFGITIPTNDLVWWIPFALILAHAWRCHHTSAVPLPNATSEDSSAPAGTAVR